MNRFTLYGLYQYDPTLFDGVKLPNGIEKDALINEIMKQSGDLYCYYQVPDRMKRNITYWFTQQYPNFDQIARSMNVMYEPLDNYDRTEETTREFENSGKDITTQKAKSNTGNIHTGSQGEVGEVSAYDTDYFSPDKKSTTTFNDSVNINNEAHDTNETEYGAKRIEKETLKVFGNVGVTPNSRVLEEEVVLRMKYNTYKMIAELFEDEFLCQIY